MARVFAWKINTGKYAYLVKKNNSYIRNRVTDKDELIRMVNTVNNYDVYEYEDKFNELHDEVYAKYAVDIGNIDQYFNEGAPNQIQLILLTGKDGDNFQDSVQTTVLTENDYNNIRDMIEASISSVNADFDSLKEELSANSITYRDQAIQATQAAITSINEKVNNIESQVADVSPAHRVEAPPAVEVPVDGDLPRKGMDFTYGKSNEDTPITLSCSDETSVNISKNEILLTSGDFGIKITPTGIKLIKDGVETDL